MSDAVSAEDLGRRIESAGLRLAAVEIESLARFAALLIRWNRVYNLTGPIRDLGELVDRHLVESLALRPLLRGERVADVGSGAGLPGMPLAIAEPARAFTLIESRAKRVRFLRHVALELGLGNVTVAHGRAELLRPDRPFDTVLARAVAPPAELLTICRPLTAPGSVLVLLTAAHLRETFRGLAPDFVLDEAGAPRDVALRSSIVLLERIKP
ncbi:MAG TPA: 16S rRNA (guanine(527)-N(7))-methyltransferase RsmG [Gammaproteobacteria bacterium]|nr:16S rRNA (guanine(527)-N(7))-methyltransferase RsmG [Gammaproteobacteria bacterium]